MFLFSYKGQEPKILPFRIRLDDGSTRTSLDKLSIESLQSLGFIGPFTKPQFNEDIQKVEWTGNEYRIINLSEEEIAQRILEKKSEEHRQKLENIDYNLFWEVLINSEIYKKIRNAALQSLEANIFYTELISLFNDAKAGKANNALIQKYINVLFLNFQFSDEEIQEFESIMDKTNLSSIYSLPDSEYLSSHYYDHNLNKIIRPSPFNSWILIDGRWEAPIPYPTDGKIYNWNEDLKNWIEI